MMWRNIECVVVLIRLQEGVAYHALVWIEVYAFSMQCLLPFMSIKTGHALGFGYHLLCWEHSILHSVMLQNIVKHEAFARTQSKEW